jgi:uncharacterized membrane protein (DUF373 family)
VLSPLEVAKAPLRTSSPSALSGKHPTRHVGVFLAKSGLFRAAARQVLNVCAEPWRRARGRWMPPRRGFGAPAPGPTSGSVSRETGSRRGSVLASRRPFDLQEGIIRAEVWIYLVIGLLLVGAAALTVVGTIADVVRGNGSRPVSDLGVFLLERILLIFIIAELLYTLRLVDFGGRILVEPFLFIGLIAVVRRILLITAEAEADGDAGDVNGFLLEIAALGALTLVLAVSIHLLRRGSAREDA